MAPNSVRIHPFESRERRTADLAVYVRQDAADWLQRAVHECIKHAASGDKIDCEQILKRNLGTSTLSQDIATPVAPQQNNTLSQDVPCVSSIQRPVGDKIEFQLGYSENHGTELFL